MQMLAGSKMSLLTPQNVLHSLHPPTTIKTKRKLKYASWKDEQQHLSIRDTACMLLTYILYV